jgi:hypothetical protein
LVTQCKLSTKKSQTKKIGTSTLFFVPVIPNKVYKNFSFDYLFNRVCTEGKGFIKWFSKSLAIALACSNDQRRRHLVSVFISGGLFRKCVGSLWERKEDWRMVFTTRGFYKLGNPSSQLQEQVELWQGKFMSLILFLEILPCHNEIFHLKNYAKVNLSGKKIWSTVCTNFFCKKVILFRLSIESCTVQC